MLRNVRHVGGGCGDPLQQWGVMLTRLPPLKQETVTDDIGRFDHFLILSSSTLGRCHFNCALCLESDVKMRIQLSYMQTVKASIHGVQLFLIFLAGCLALAILTKAGHTGAQVGFYFGLVCTGRSPIRSNVTLADA